MQLRQNRTYRRQIVKPGRFFSVGPTTARYLILMLLAVFSLLFLIESAQGSDGLITLRNLEDQKSAAKQELTTLQVNAGRLQSLPTLSQTAKDQGFVPIESNPETITVPPTN